MTPTEQYGLWEVLTPSEEQVFNELVTRMPYGVRAPDLKRAVWEGQTGKSTVYTVLHRLKRKLEANGWVLEHMPSHRYIVYRADQA